MLSPDTPVGEIEPATVWDTVTGAGEKGTVRVANPPVIGVGVPLITFTSNEAFVTVTWVRPNAPSAVITSEGRVAAKSNEALNGPEPAATELGTAPLMLTATCGVAEMPRPAPAR